MTYAPCLLTSRSAPVVSECWRRRLLQELWRLCKQESFKKASLGWIYHTKACTLRNMRLSQACFVLVLAGKKVLLSNNMQTEEVLPGQALFIPAGRLISCINTPQVEGEYIALTMSFDAKLLERVRQRISITDNNLAEYNSKIECNLEPLQECAYNFMRLLSASDDPMLPLMQQEQMVYLLWKLGIPVFLAPHNLIIEIRTLVETKPNYTWSAQELADHMFMTERTLRRHLNGLGTSLSELVRISRLHCGLGMLMGGEARIGDVAMRCGYSSPSRFAARFRELFGLTPTELLSSRKNIGQASVRKS